MMCGRACLLMSCTDYIKYIFPLGKQHKLFYRHMTFKHPVPFWQIYKPIGGGIWILTGPWLHEWCPWTESVNRSCLTHTHTVNRWRSTGMRLGLEHINQDKAYKQVPWCNTSKPQGLRACMCVCVWEWLEIIRRVKQGSWIQTHEQCHMWQNYISTPVQTPHIHTEVNGTDCKPAA